MTAPERPELTSTARLLALTPDAIELTALGRRFVRNVFDRHPRAKAAHAMPVFSRTV